MDQPTLRPLIQEKFAEERLPRDDISRQWSGPGDGETCDGCGERVSLDIRGHGIQFHLACFYLWDVERHVPGDEPSAPLPARSALRAAGGTRSKEHFTRQTYMHPARSCARRRDDASYHLDDRARPGAAWGRRRSSDE
jgi:hypothetical protein